jgi:hypothetical protein
MGEALPKGCIRWEEPLAIARLVVLGAPHATLVGRDQPHAVAHAAKRTPTRAHGR